MKNKDTKAQHYCDSCIFIGFLNQEPDKFQQCKDIIEAAELDYIKLYTSAFTMAEVVKIKVNNCSEIEQEQIIQLFHILLIIPKKLSYKNPLFKDINLNYFKQYCT